MALYDNESSGEEDNDYIETNVLLGYASKDPSDDIISHLGGRPEWLDPSAPPPSAALAKCKVCNNFLVLLLQLNGDLPEHFPWHERRLYILSCRGQACRRKEGSVRVLRGTRISEEKKKQCKPAAKADPGPLRSAVNIGETLFGSKSLSGLPSSNPFSLGVLANTSSSLSQEQNPFTPPSASASELAAKPPQARPSMPTDLRQTFASALSLNSTPPVAGPPPPPVPWPSDSAIPPAYPAYYLVDANYEILDKIEDAATPATTMDLDEGGDGGGKEDTEVFESSIDKAFQKFADRMEQNPEQVLRYEFKGSPLLYSKTDAVGKALSASNGEGKVRAISGSGMPRCGNCGGARVFEVQLTPHAIMELEREEDGIDGMEWGTIIVGVCERDCVQNHVENGEVGYIEEWAGVQWEELNVKR